MPRALVFANGEMLVNLDRFLSIRDLYYPYVGWANHVGGHFCRVGVWAENAGFAWLGEDWAWRVAYQPDTLASDCAATHAGLGIRLRAVHAVLHDRTVFVTRFRLENLRPAPRQARLFLAHDLRVDESDIGDTVFYNPYAHALVHYKRDRYFLFGGYAGREADALGPDQYACGEKGFRGAQGAWADAEDGQLSMNAIAQGAVDSVAAYPVSLPAAGSQTVRTWIIAGETLGDVTGQQARLLEDGFDTLLDKTAVRWFQSARTARPDLDTLPDPVARLYTRSLLLMRTQCDKRGAILASNDTDIMETARAHYSYLWPRDGALVSMALDSAGQREKSRAFFEFCARILPKDRAAFLHKYGPDGTVGASWHPWVVDGKPEVPFQEDGTALVIYALWNHVKGGQDAGFAASQYEKLLRPCADFLAAYRDSETHLPRPSWDLWEERRGCHIWTVATVIAALRAAADYALSLGQAAPAKKWRDAAEQVRDALQYHFWDEGAGRFARMVKIGDDGAVTRDLTVDSSAAALFLFGALPPDDPHLIATMQSIGRALWVKTGVGGLARYENDPYFRVAEDPRVPGNPWIICTLWLADWAIAAAQSRADLRAALDLLTWATGCASPTGLLSEQVHPLTRAPLSVAPLTWSHAQYVATTSAYLDALARLS